MLTETQLSEIKKFNQNVDWLRKNHRSEPYENTGEWIYLGEAMKVLNRKRTWIQTRMVEAADAVPPINLNWFLVRGLDYQHEGKLLVFKRSSIARLKAEMVRMGAPKESAF